MYQKMTYKQALIRSLIIGFIVSVCVLPIYIDSKLDSTMLGTLSGLLLLILNGLGILLNLLYFWVGLKDRLLVSVIECVSPLIACLLSGNIVFLIFKNSKWLTLRNFILTLLGAYLLVSIFLAILSFMLTIVQFYIECETK